MRKALITGISGFAGSFLAEHLLSQKNYEVFGTYHSSQLTNIASIQSDLTLFRVDLSSEEEIHEVIAKVRPDVVFHLAAMASPAQSFKDPAETVSTNITGQIHLLEALRKEKMVHTRILITSSADVYGKVKKEDLPIDEETPFVPTNPYAVSKITQDYLGLQYALSYNLAVIRVRPFNHIGPRQAPSFVVSSFAKRIAEIERGKHPPIITVGNLSAKRDFTDVRDMVRAYASIIERGNVEEVYNIGSGESYTIANILDMLLSLTKEKISVVVDQHLMRPLDTPELLCDASKLKKTISWEREIPLEISLKETLDYWRNIV